VSGRDLLADPAVGGLIRSVRETTTLHQQTSDGVQSDVATVERRYDPRRLPDDDDDRLLRQ